MTLCSRFYSINCANIKLVELNDYCIFCFFLVCLFVVVVDVVVVAAGTTVADIKNTRGV